MKIVAALAVAVGLLVVVRACSRRSSVPASPGQPLPKSVSRSELGADGDTETETLRTLISEIKALHEEYTAVESDNKTLREQNARLQRMEDRISGRLDDKLRGTQTQIQQQTQRVERQNRDTETLLETLERRVSDLSGSGAKRPVGKGSDIPVGLGLDNYSSSSAVVWVDPLDAPSAGATGKRGFPAPIESLVGKVEGGPGAGHAKRPAPEPVYTVPRNSTLVGAHGFTALVGRIPVRGQVVDPFPFKVLVGADNLAANGVVMPELFGMVFSGRAVGDWTLSCVRGDVYSVTFVFQDGTIQSYPKGDTDTQDSRPIGWISDAYGVPCVKGQRKTNAESFLSERIGLAAASAAAKAAAAAETSTTVSRATGTATTSVTGDISSFIRNRTASEGVDEVSRWLAERQAQSFDAIYVPPDSELVVHVTREFDIDHDSQGRKVIHHAELEGSLARPLD